MADSHDVIVVGGGIAGLAAAWELRDLDVVVLEAGDRAGGRLKSERRGDYWLNFGAHVFGGAGTATDTLLREAGLESAEIPGALAAVELNGRVVNGGRVATYPFRLPLALKDRAALIRTGLRLRLAVAAYDKTFRSGGNVAAFHGDETFTDWLGAVPADVDALFRPTLERSSSEPEGLSAGYGIGYFHLVWDRSGGLARSILGGSGSLPAALAAQLPVRLNAPVDEIAIDGDGIRVGELRARAAVVATPAHVTHRIVRDLPDDTRDALAQIRYGPYVVAAFLTNETEPMPWDDIYALAAARRSFNLFFNMASVLRRGPRRPGGSLMVYAGADLARRLWDRDDERAAEAFVADIDAIFPGARAVIAETIVQRWEHGLPYGFPGRYRLQPALERDLGPLALAGDYLGMRHTETAIASGRAAAAAVRRRIAA